VFHNGFTLLVAKVDRLTGNLHFVTALTNSKVDFLAADSPQGTPWRNTSGMIPNRTKLALDAARRRGVKLGNPQYATPLPKAIEAHQKIAADRNAELRKTVAEVMAKTALTKLAEIAEALNLRGIKANRGCEFTPTHLHLLLKAA